MARGNPPPSLHGVLYRDTLLSFFIAQSTWIKDFGRELFVYLFNPFWHEDISHKVIFQPQADYDILNTKSSCNLKNPYVLDSIIFI